MTQGRGSYIRVFAADFDGDGIAELTTPNKGAQSPGPEDYARSTPVELYTLSGDPLSGGSWQRKELGSYSIPQNAEPVDLDSDDDMDIVVDARGDVRLVNFENLGSGSLEFEEHAIGINGGSMGGFNLEYTDLSYDGRLDIIGMNNRGQLIWIEQPEHIDNTLNDHTIGSILPNVLVGMEIADVDNYGDGDMDFLSTRGNSAPFDGVFWLEQVRSKETHRIFKQCGHRKVTK